MEDAEEVDIFALDWRFRLFFVVSFGYFSLVLSSFFSGGFPLRPNLQRAGTRHFLLSLFFLRLPLLGL